LVFFHGFGVKTVELDPGFGILKWIRSQDFVTKLEPEFMFSFSTGVGVNIFAKTGARVKKFRLRLWTALLHL